MRQAVMIQPGKIELNEVEEPVAGPGEILLRVKKKVKKSFGDEWFDVAFEAAGIEASLDDAVQNIQKGGDIVVLDVFRDRPRVDMSVVGDRELGRLEEARAEVSKLLEKNPHYTLKSLNNQPYGNRRECLINDLRKAGVPE